MGFLDAIDPHTFDDEDWKLILAYIGAKQTHLPEFQTLYEKVLNAEVNHSYQRQLKTLSMLYDFTPIKPPEGQLDKESSTSDSAS